MSRSIDDLIPLAGAPRRILILDDEECIRKMMGDMAESLQVEVIMASSVAEGVAALEQKQFGLLVVDICMPEKSGLVFIKHVRDSQEHAACPVLVFSGYYPDNDLGKVENAFENCIAMMKPVSLERLQEVIEKVLPPAGSPSGGAQCSPRILTFALKIDHSSQTASVVFSNSSKDAITDAEVLLEKLNENSVKYGIDTDMVHGVFARSFNDFSPGEEVVVASGKAPVDGEAGRVDYRFDTSVKASYHPEETGEFERVDYKTTTHISMAKDGDLLAEIIAPTSGEDGMNLEGKAIPASAGKPVSLASGDGVKMDDEGRFFYATASGRPVVVSNTLKVTPVYEVEGDVDYETGSIVFKHHVDIRGDVKDDFSLECGSAEIHGAVGAAVIHCTNDLVIHSGVNGHNRAQIDVGGTLHSKYLNQATVTSAGDVTVEKEIINCRVWTQGSLTAQQIIGGEAVALSGIRTDEAGSEMGVPTRLEPGTNFEEHRIRLQIEATEKELDAVLAPAERYFDDRDHFRSLPDDRQMQIREGLDVFLRLKEQHESLTAERESLSSADFAEPVREVVVEKILHPDVTVATELCSTHFRLPKTGPMKLVEDPDNSDILCVSKDGEENADGEEAEETAEGNVEDERSEDNEGTAVSEE